MTKSNNPNVIKKTTKTVANEQEKIKITQEDKKRLWEGIDKFFLNHPNEFIKRSFVSHRHEENYQKQLVSAVIQVIFIAKLAAFSLHHAFEVLPVLREAVNQGRVDNALEAELKIFMANNFLSENLTKQQLNDILSINVRHSDYSALRSASLNKNYSNKEIKKFRDIIGQFKRDYMTIFEQNEYMNQENNIERE